MTVSESSVKRRLERIFEGAGQAGTGWWALSCVHVRHQGGQTDVDVLVGVPGLGLLVLEVKGWKQFKIESGGKWSYLSGDPRNPKSEWVELSRNPFDQVERTQFLLIEALRGYVRTGALRAGSLPRCESAVLFGGFSESELNGKIPANYEKFALSRDDLLMSEEQPDEASCRSVLDRLKRLFQNSANQHQRITDNGSSRLGEIGNVLEPTCHIVGMSSLLSESKEALNHNAELAMSVRAESLDRNRVYVEGKAGTGKTVLGLQIALQETTRSDLPALYVCYSPRLAEQIREVNTVQDAGILVFTPELLAEHLGLRDMVEFLATEEIRLQQDEAELLSLVGGAGAGDAHPLRAYLGSAEFWTRLFEAAADQGRLFCAVVVDEAQDLFEPAFETLEQLVSDGGKFVILCDPRQTTRRERAGKKWEVPVSVSSGTMISLETNLRNPTEVISAVERHCRVEYKRLSRNVPDGLVRWKTYKKDTFLSVVAEELEELGKLHVGTVVMHSSLSEAQLSELRRGGIESSDVDSNKGLEWDSVVLIVGMERNPLDPNPEEVYVGMTRARVHMTVVHHVTDLLFTDVG